MVGETDTKIKIHRLSSRTASSMEKNKAGKGQGVMLFGPVTVREDISQKVAFEQRAENSGAASHGDPWAGTF